VLGTDTAGSVRVPAACCGVLGFRPSHGAVTVVGVVPMAQSFDTVGKQSASSLLSFGPCHGLIGLNGIFMCVCVFFYVMWLLLLFLHPSFRG
jgi:hypothetical protein